MPKIALCNDPDSYAGDTQGTLVSMHGSSGVTFQGKTIALVGDKVHAHTTKKDAHAELASTCIAGSPNITIGGIPVVRHGDATSCGHPVTVVDSSHSISGN